MALRAMTDATQRVEPNQKWRIQGVWPLLICFLAAVLLASTRRPNPFYIYGEDGVIFYGQPHEFGLRSVFTVYGGYLHVALRLMALGLAYVPPAQLPYAMTIASWVVQAGVATFIFSEQLSNLVPSRFYRGLLALMYMGLPDIEEIYGHFVNLQWHLAVFAALLIFARVPATTIGKAARLLLVMVLSLTGPFMFFQIPVIAVKWYRSRRRYDLATLICALPSVIQIVIAASGRDSRPWKDLLRPMLFPRIVGGRGFFGAAISPRLYDHFFMDAAVLYAASFVAIVLCIYAVVKKNRFATILLYLGTVIMLTSLHSGIGSIAGRLDPRFSARYYFAFGYGLMATVLFIFYSEKPTVRWATAALIVVLLSWSWTLPTSKKFWPRYNRALVQYDRAKPGTIVAFPEFPDDWVFKITKR